MRHRALAVALFIAPVCLVSAAAAWAAPPTVTYTLSGVAGDNGWFRGPVTVVWSVNWNNLPAVASTGCDPAVRLASDSKGTTLSCQAENTDGTTTTKTRPIQIDQTPPVATAAAAARPPEATGFYRAPVSVAWTGTDALSGLASCTNLTYGGPDGAAQLAGTCRDLAGNVSAPLQFSLGYDATPPTLTAVNAAGGDTVATISWQAAGAAAVTVTRSPGVRGRAATVVYEGTGARYEDTGLHNRAAYTYTVSASDAAGNVATAKAKARTSSQLRAPRAGARVSRPPLLRWSAVRGARYYNVQLFLGTRKVLSEWPRHPRLRLERSWRYRGHNRRLTPGLYRWFVWPGYGRRTQHRYGRLLGTRRFVVAPR